MVGQMYLNGLTRRLWNMQQEVNRARSVGFKFRPRPFGGGVFLLGALHREMAHRGADANAGRERGKRFSTDGVGKQELLDIRR